ncbi:RNHCP domain-containing protein [Cellulosimicrobium cellulans]|uniref:RNHCP domain protein n=1 Tax=Cellulosimicrobium funkei TaxID=264251 RepID=A0A0H2KQP8_9MICO|nr:MULTISPECIES: RNHCP domain-containing protein [Cellulosimicrobium]KLN34144.1 RNHCP domain protein [Cellulosimicrobium funkei]KZM77376.1 RNHCP domain protein [Cellulosimicrobium sp. I38E]
MSSNDTDSSSCNNTDSSHTPSRHVSSLETFSCVQCGFSVPARTPQDRWRNHCPVCLYSRHDVAPTEAETPCGSRMRPIAIAVLRTGEWMLIHRCVACAHLTSSPVAPDDNQIILMRMAVRPLAEPPFPLESFGTL